MKKSFSVFSLLFVMMLVNFLAAVEHPRIFITESEALEIRQALGKSPLMDKSYQSVKAEVYESMQKGIEVPDPGEAGGYEHEKHKQNYRDMQHAGILYVISGEEKYARFVRNMLIKYAKLYPTLDAHPLAHNQAPGKLFHQMLNETVWLLYTSQAYDCIYNWLNDEDREYIEKNVFRQIIDWFTTRNAHEFDRIHNHGTWSVAAVGMIGLILDDEDLVEMSLYGTEKNGEGGFLKQLDLLFSPDGYYMEGPYYIRYALRPLFFFAEALERYKPELKIYQYRDEILRKAYYAAVKTIFPDGIFPPINDASKTMDIGDPGVVLSNDLVYDRYGPDPNLLGIARFQNEVILNGSGLRVSQDLKEIDGEARFVWESVEFRDGTNGEMGGLGILRMGAGLEQNMLLMKYGVHGEGHGHFDKLHFLFYDQGREIINDYGFARWINIEPKFGGRYLDENKSYAMQTIAHNTVVVDETTQNKGDRKQADRVWGSRHFFYGNDPDVKVMSAFANSHYPGVLMQRTMFLISDSHLEYPVIVDLYRLKSDSMQQYDYPIHFTGQLINTNFQYNTFIDKMIPMALDSGYEHIWKEAAASVKGNIFVTWLNGNRYYSWLTFATPGSRFFFGRIGANDPDFNLRSEPLFILRSSNQNHLFVSVFEPHGYFNEARERSENARPLFNKIVPLGFDDTSSVVKIEGKGDLKWLIKVWNKTSAPEQEHSVIFDDREFTWTGDYEVDLNVP